MILVAYKKESVVEAERNFLTKNAEVYISFICFSSVKRFNSLVFTLDH